MRVALISEHASPLACLGGVDAGGQNVYVDKVARELAARGHVVDVLTRRDDTSLPAIVEMAPGVRVVHVEAGPARFIAKEKLLEHMPEFAARVLQRVRTGTCYELVHANFFMSGWVGLRLKAQLGLPLVMTFHALGAVRRAHQGASDGFPEERLDIERRLVAEADRLIAECPQDEADLVELYRAAPHRVSTVPCGVDLDELAGCDRGSARHKLGLGDDDFVVLQLGRMVPRKGVDNVIRGVARVADDPRVRLLVVGGDAPAAGTTRSPELRRLMSLATDCGIGERVSFAGQRQRRELACYYAACDVFVSTPWYEPFGITPLEAMAAARPVIGSAVGGLKHSVVDGQTGFLVPPHDPDALADRLRRLLAEPALGRAMGRAGLRRARQRFTWAGVAEQLERAYHQAVAHAGRRPAAPGAALRLPRPATVGHELGRSAA